MADGKVTARPARDWLSRYVLPLCLAVLAFWSFRGTLDVFFVQDDFWFLSAVQQPLPNRMMLTGVLPDFFRPLPTYWFPLVNQFLWGLNPWGFHLSQLAVFALTIFALYRALYRVSGSAIAASFGAVTYGLAEAHLFTLGWIAGAIDVLAACFFALALWVVASYEAEKSPLWPVGVFLGLALLSKEIVVMLPLAWMGAQLARGMRAWIHRETWLTPRGQRLTILFGALLGVYFAVWIIFTTGHNSASQLLEVNGARAVYVLLNSLIAVLPGVKFYEPLSAAWLLAPVLLCVAAIVLSGGKRQAWAICALLLWLAPALVFAVTKKPADLQPYYGHFSIFGLAFLAALFVASVIERLRDGWPRRLAQAALVIGLAAYAWASAAVVQEGVLAHRSPALTQAVYSRAAYDQLVDFTAGKSYREIIFLDTSDLMWWSVGKGVMIPVMFSSVAAQFDGYAGYTAPPDTKTSGTALVVRQVSDTEFVVVK